VPYYQLLFFHSHVTPTIELSHIVPIGGRVLEHWLYGFAPHKYLQKFMDAKYARAPGEDAISLEANTEIVTENQGLIMGYVIYHMSAVAQKSKMQQFFVSFNAKFQGLSLRGIGSMASLGYVSKLSYFKDKLKDAKINSLHDVERCVTPIANCLLPHIDTHREASLISCSCCLVPACLMMLANLTLSDTALPMQLARIIKCNAIQFHAMHLKWPHVIHQTAPACKSLHSFNTMHAHAPPLGQDTNAEWVRIYTLFCQDTVQPGRKS
jgi:hypothetical protein